MKFNDFEILRFPVGLFQDMLDHIDKSPIFAANEWQYVHACDSIKAIKKMDDYTITMQTSIDNNKILCQIDYRGQTKKFYYDAQDYVKYLTSRLIMHDMMMVSKMYDYKAW